MEFILAFISVQQLTPNLRYVVVKVHNSWREFQDYFRQQVFLISNSFRSFSIFFSVVIVCLYMALSFMQDGEKRLLAFTKRGTNIHSVCSHPFILLWYS